MRQWQSLLCYSLSTESTSHVLTWTLRRVCSRAVTLPVLCPLNVCYACSVYDRRPLLLCFGPRIDESARPDAARLATLQLHRAASRASIGCQTDVRPRITWRALVAPRWLRLAAMCSCGLSGQWSTGCLRQAGTGRSGVRIVVPVLCSREAVWVLWLSGGCGYGFTAVGWGRAGTSHARHSKAM